MLKVKVFDRYRFAIPVYGLVIERGGSGRTEGLKVRLLTTNNHQYPVGSEIWVHSQQCRVLVSENIY